MNWSNKFTEVVKVEPGEEILGYTALQAIRRSTAGWLSVFGQKGGSFGQQTWWKSNKWSISISNKDLLTPVLGYTSTKWKTTCVTFAVMGAQIESQDCMKYLSKWRTSTGCDTIYIRGRCLKVSLPHEDNLA